MCLRFHDPGIKRSEWSNFLRVLCPMLRIQTLLMRIRILLFTLIQIWILLFNFIRTWIRLFDTDPNSYRFFVGWSNRTQTKGILWYIFLPVHFVVLIWEAYGSGSGSWTPANESRIRILENDLDPCGSISGSVALTMSAYELVTCKHGTLHTVPPLDPQQF